jgi:tetratricopeptide (TPR) repeat protein
MFQVAIVVACILAPQADPEDSAAKTRSDYARALRSSGHGANSRSHLALALWCEQHGLTHERAEHLTKAILADPHNALARALLGQIKGADGRWVRADLPPPVDQARAAARAEYEQRRVAIDDKPGAHWNLALWCEEQGLADEARAHLTRVTWLDPKREAAWKRLGGKKVNGHWLTEAEAAREKVEKDAQQSANRTWRLELKKLRDGLSDPRKRRAAEFALSGVSDPRAVSAIWSMFVTARQPNVDRGVQLLGQIDSREASRALATIVLFAPNDETRRRAAEVLRHRDPREFADIFISLLQKPIMYQVRPVAGPGSPGELFVEGKRINLRRIYQAPAPPTTLPGDEFAGLDDFGLPVISRPGALATGGQIAGRSLLAQPNSMSSELRAQLVGLGQQIPDTASGATARHALNALAQLPARTGDLGSGPWAVVGGGGGAVFGNPSEADIAESENRQTPINSNTQFVFTYQSRALIPLGQAQLEAEKAAMSSQDQLERDVALLEAWNQRTASINDLATGVLRQVSDEDFGDDSELWTKWLVDQFGFRLLAQRVESGPETVTELIPPSYWPEPVPVVNTLSVVSYTRVSCFGAGTPVHTREGLRPIEELRVGDVVLSFDPTSGSLGYQPVLAVHHNPPSDTFDLKASGETIVTSTYHRFWSPGLGWKIARDLKPGDRLRTLGGVIETAASERGKSQPVYNLDVAGGHTFFVGKIGLLVHDNTLPELRAKPFDSVDKLD